MISCLPDNRLGRDARIRGRALARKALMVLIAQACLATTGVCEADDRSVSVEDALRRSREIQGEVARLRGLNFTNEIATAVQTPSDFRQYIRKAIARQFGELGPKPYVDALVKIGVLKHSVDLEATFLSLLESQAAAHYDPETKTYYLLSTNAPAAALDLISSHELCHALQDQHFDLYSFLEKDVEAIRDNGDQNAARQCLVEGEATLVMLMWTVIQQTGMTNSPVLESAASMAVAFQAAMDFDGILSLVESGVQGADPALSGMISAMGDLRAHPRYFLETMYAFYINGSMMVDYVKSRGGWAAVERLYRNPPESTEQVLHPEKLLGERDDPTDVRLAGLLDGLGDEWELAEEDVLGELGTRILCELWCGEGPKGNSFAVSAAEGWDGDRYYYFVNPASGSDLLVWKTVWDSPEEAAEFATACRLILAVRFPSMKKAWSSDRSGTTPFQVWEVEPGRFVKLAKVGGVVGVIDTTDQSALDVLWR